MALSGHSLIAETGELRRAEILIAGVALVFVTAIAADLPSLLDNLFALRAPVLSFVIPPFAIFYAPILLLVLWFNGIARGSGHLSATIDPGLVSAALLVFSLLAIESAHAFGNSIPDFEIVMDLAWALLLFFTLRSFSYQSRWAETMLVTAAICCSILSIISMAVPLNSLFDIGLSGFFFQPRRPQWNGVNSHSYFAAAVSLIALHRLLFFKLTPLQKMFWGATILINLIAIVANKSRGAWIAALLSIILIAIARITGWNNRRILLSAALLVATTAGTALFLRPTELDYFISLGRGLAPAQEFIVTSDLKAQGADKSSITVRMGMIRGTMDIFLQNPIFGQGWSAVSDMRFTSHSLHGVVQVIAASYGIIGLLLLASFIYFNVPNFFGANTSRLGPPLLLIMLVSVVVRPAVPLWFAIVLVALPTLPNDIKRTAA